MRNLLPLHLQFFADEESVNTPEVAEPEATVETAEETVEEETPEEAGEKEPEPAAPVQTPEENARFAAARRREAEAVNRRIAERFKGVKNPITGAEIKTLDDYLQALDAQEEASRRQMLQEKGLDPSIIDQAIQRNPAVIAAAQIMEEQKKAQKDRQIADQIAEISKVNPDIKSVQDLSKDKNFVQIFDKWKATNYEGNLYDIYRLVNFDDIVTKKTEAVKQAAINQAKGKGHLEATGASGATDSSLVEIPESELSIWREYYPNATMDELKKKYNKTL